MKAIYINLDPYLAQIAAWLNAGKPGTAPSFQPLPLAVTIPLGESACIFAPGGAGAHEGEEATYDVGGTILAVIGTGDFAPESESAIATNIQIGLSRFPHQQGYNPQSYSVLPVSGDMMATMNLSDSDQTFIIPLTIPVLVRREQASGPVDLVDFAPPSAAPTAAQINAALGGTGAAEGQPLNGVSLGGANIVATNTNGATTFTKEPGGDPINITADSGASMGAALGALTASA